MRRRRGFALLSARGPAHRRSVMGRPRAGRARPGGGSGLVSRFREGGRVDEDAEAGHYVKLELRTAKDRYCRGEPIIVECRLVNGSKTLDAQYFCMYGRYCNPRRSDVEFHIGVARKGVAVGTTRFGSHLGGFAGSHRPFPHGAGIRDV